MTSTVGPAWPRTVLCCPVDDCDWQFDMTPQPPADLNAVGAYLVDPEAAVRRLWQAADDAAQEHMDSHSVVEFLATIARLNGQLVTARRLLGDEAWAQVERA